MATQAAEPPSGEECALYDPFDAPLPPTFKIVTCGDLWSGKTTLLERWCLRREPQDLAPRAVLVEGHLPHTTFFSGMVCQIGDNAESIGSEKDAKFSREASYRDKKRGKYTYRLGIWDASGPSKETERDSRLKLVKEKKVKLLPTLLSGKQRNVQGEHPLTARHLQAAAPQQSNASICGKGREDCYPHARMFLVCLDQSLDDPEVQLSAHGWVDEIRRRVPDAFIVLVLTKSDYRALHKLPSLDLSSDALLARFPQVSISALTCELNELDILMGNLFTWCESYEEQIASLTPFQYSKDVKRVICEHGHWHCSSLVYWTWFEPPYTCAECKRELELAVDTVRYHCWEDNRHEGGVGADLCEKCYKTSGHPHPCYAEPITSPPDATWHRYGYDTIDTLRRMFEFFSSRPAIGGRVRLGKVEKTKINETGDEKDSLIMNQQLEIPTAEEDSRSISTPPRYGPYKWISFNELYERALDVGAALRTLLPRRGFMGISSRNREEFFITDYGAIFEQICCLAIHTNSTVEMLSCIVKNADLALVLCETPSDALSFLKTIEGGQTETEKSTLRHIFYMDYGYIEANKEAEELALAELLRLGKENGVVVREYSWLEETGRNLRTLAKERVLSQFIGTEEAVQDGFALAPNDLFTIMYTSGSTGLPKGVIIPETSWNNAILEVCGPPVTDPFVVLSFEPLAHVTRRNNQMRLIQGGRYGMFPEEMGSQWFEDIQLLQPSSLSGVPRLWNRLYEEYQHIRARALSKVPPQQRTQQLERATDELCYEQMRKMLGGRITMVSTGSALCSLEVLHWMKTCFKCTVWDSYGITETGGISYVQQPNRNPFKGGVLDESERCQVGGSLMKVEKNVQLKLISCEEMGYCLENKPFPQGEILVKTKTMAGGYYKDTEKTRESFDDDGWFHTGDIGQMEGKDMIRIIDRKKNLVKLSQGEFISASRLEAVYTDCPIARQVFIHVDQTSDVVVAVVLLSPFSQLGDSLSDEERQASVLKEMQAWGYGRLYSYEIIRGVVVGGVGDQWSAENGLLTASNKLCRPALAKYYDKELVECVKRAKKQLAEQEEVTRARTSELVQGILQEKGGSSQSIVQNHQSKSNLVSMGVDSLSAAKFSLRIREEYGVVLPPHLLFQEDTTVDSVAEYIEKHRYAPQTTASRELLKEDVVEVERDLQLADSLQFSSSSSLPSSTPHIILLTGATGFLGAFLAIALRKCYSRDYRVACLVRASNTETARSRLLGSLREYELVEGDSLPEGVDAIAGDLVQVRLGLSDSKYRELRESLAAVVASAAHVNTLAAYPELRDDNVIGTLRLLELCAVNQKSLEEAQGSIENVTASSNTSSLHEVPLHFISTLTTCGVSPMGSIAEEDGCYGMDTIRKWGRRGYLVSKWMGENMVKRAGARGLKYTIWRPGTISGSSVSGASNSPAYINRLLCGICQMQAYPEVDGNIDMTPVDWIAKTVARASQKSKFYGKSYNIVNRHMRPRKPQTTPATCGREERRKDTEQERRAQKLQSILGKEVEAGDDLVGASNSSEVVTMKLLGAWLSSGGETLDCMSYGRWNRELVRCARDAEVSAREKGVVGVDGEQGGKKGRENPLIPLLSYFEGPFPANNYTVECPNLISVVEDLDAELKQVHPSREDDEKQDSDVLFQTEETSVAPSENSKCDGTGSKRADLCEVCRKQADWGSDCPPICECMVHKLLYYYKRRGLI